MKKLEDIPKKNIFEVPDGYFDRLPLKIQARLETPSPTRSVLTWNLAFRYVLPAVVAVFAIIFVLQPKVEHNTEELLAGISNEHLIAYLHETDINVSELLEAANFDEDDADSLNLGMNLNYLLGDFDAVEFKSVLENEL